MKKALLTGIKFENFIDIDSGKGKPCIYMANKNYFSKIIGVEYSGELVKIAEKTKIYRNLVILNSYVAMQVLINYQLVIV
jgi:tRNA G46 methylase TrmB